MALSLTIDYPSVEVIDNTRSTPSASPYGMAIMLGTGTTTANDKKLTLINSLTDFDAKIGATSPSRKYVEAFFANLSNSSIRLYFYKVQNVATAAVQADWIAALNGINIDPTVNPGGIIIAPEFFDAATVAADITAFGNALDTFCNTESDSYWISIVDLPLTNASIADAVTTRNRFTPAKGNLITYQPYYYKNAVKMSPSAAMAANCLSAWAGNRFSNVPAGLNYPIKDATSLGYSLSKADLVTAHANGINAIRYFPASGYIPFDSITLSNQSAEYFQINSVVCFKVVCFLVEQEMMTYIHQSIAGNVELLTQVESGLTRLLNSAWESGYLAGETQSEAFTIKSTLETLPPPNNSMLVFEGAVRPSYALQKILFYLKNRITI